jgi:hypothetical protein
MNNIEEQRIQEIFLLMTLGKMTLTEINTLTDKQRIMLLQMFIDKLKKEEEFFKRESQRGTLSI